MSQNPGQCGFDDVDKDPRLRFICTEGIEIVHNPPGPPEPWEIEFDRELEEEIRQDIANTPPLYKDEPVTPPVQKPDGPAAGGG